MDFDGTFHHTIIRVLTFDNIHGVSIRPTIGKNLVTLVADEAFEADANIEVTDIDGRLVTRYELLAGEIERPMDISSWASGHYLVRLSVDGQSFTLRFVKVNH